MSDSKPICPCCRSQHIIKNGKAEQICYVGSGAVESAISADCLQGENFWGIVENRACVLQVLSVRCAYLNGLLAI